MRNFKIELTFISIVGITAIGVWGWKSFSPSHPTAQAKPKDKPQLLKDKDVKHFTNGCLAPRGEFLEAVGKINQYTLVAFSYDLTQPPPWPDVPEGIKLSKSYGKDMHAVEAGHDHAHRFKVEEPNLDFALMVSDPTLGCKPTVRSLRSESIAAAFSEKDRVKIQKLRWAYTGALLEQRDRSDLQNYLTERLTHNGPNRMGLSPDSVKALTAMKIELPKWYDLSFSKGERTKAEYEQMGIKNYKVVE